jgi:hypothetical protein
MTKLPKGYRFIVGKTSETLFPKLSKGQHSANNQWFLMAYNRLTDNGEMKSPDKSYQTIRKVEQTCEWEVL